MAKTKHPMELWYASSWSAGANWPEHQVWRHSEQLEWTSIFGIFLKIGQKNGYVKNRFYKEASYTMGYDNQKIRLDLLIPNLQ